MSMGSRRFSLQHSWRGNQIRKIKMTKSKFTFSSKEPEPTLDRSKIIEDFGWYEQEISVARLMQLMEEHNLRPDQVVVALSFMNDPYNENPHLLLMKI